MAKCNYTADCIPKRCLKKCRSCGLKKRSCAINNLSCKALSRRCYNCKKQGHFPKSIRCIGSKRRFIRKKHQQITVDEKIIDSKHYQDNLFTKSSDITVPQFDGGNDENTNKIFTKKVYAVNCEIFL